MAKKSKNNKNNHRENNVNKSKQFPDGGGNAKKEQVNETKAEAGSQSEPKDTETKKEESNSKVMSCDDVSCKNHKKCNAYQNCNHYKVSRLRDSYMWFIGITSAFILGMVLFLCYRFTSTQDSIKQLQLETHNLSKNVFDSIYSKLEQTPVDCDSLISIVAKDTVLAAKIKNYDEVKRIIVGLANNLAYKDLADELKKDSLLINRQIADNLSSTKTLLDMQFNRIQNEYMTLALWAGILTIVFLIFSFYSMFKTDDMLRQGKEGLLALKEEEKSILDQLGKQRDKYIKDTETRFAGISSTADQTLLALELKASDFEGRLNPLELQNSTITEVFKQANVITADLQNQLMLQKKDKAKMERTITKLQDLASEYEQKIKELGGAGNE